MLHNVPHYLRLTGWVIAASLCRELAGETHPSPGILASRKANLELASDLRLCQGGSEPASGAACQSLTGVGGRHCGHNVRVPVGTGSSV